MNTRQIRVAGRSDNDCTFLTLLGTLAAVLDEPVVDFGAAEIVGFCVLVVRKSVVAYPLVNGAAGVVTGEVFAQLVNVHPLGRTGFAGVLLQECGEFLDPVA